MAEVVELDDVSTANNNKTDADLGKAHEYEGNFKVGDIVRVNQDIRLWHVKASSKDGFIAKGFEGTVQGFDLYGRKYYGSLCSAITPIRVEFQPDSKGLPEGMFDKKFMAHFAASELDLISRAEEGT